MIGRLLLEIVETHNRTMFAALQDEGAAIARDAAEAWHGRVIEMIEAGDVDAAVDLWERHLREAADLTLERLGPTTIIDLLDHDS
jgi:DNA-binding GntR family transcriptional regulator